MGVNMDMSQPDNQPLWRLLQIVQKLEDTVTQTLTKTADRRSCKDEIGFRQKRNGLFPAGYFADAAWDILLDLYTAHLSGRRISTTGLGLVGGIPQTTMLRYLDQLVRDGLAVRLDDPHDGRRVFVELTAEGVKRMAVLFDDAIVQQEQNIIADLAEELSSKLPESNSRNRRS